MHVLWPVAWCSCGATATACNGTHKNTQMPEHNTKLFAEFALTLCTPNRHTSLLRPRVHIIIWINIIYMIMGVYEMMAVVVAVLMWLFRVCVCV